MFFLTFIFISCLLNQSLACMMSSKVTSTTAAAAVTTTTTPLVINTTATDPMVVSWLKASKIGYGNYVADVSKIQYSANYVYVYASGIPGYSIGPWTANPNTPYDQNAIYKFPRNPSRATTKTKVSLGNIGAWINGVGIYNADDGQSYMNQGIWNRNAYVWEKDSFDSCNGHPGPGGVYHHHVNPVCLYRSTDSSRHSPLIGFAFDGYPIYGPYGYTDPNNPSSAIKLMVPSYRLRPITVRQSLENGTVLSASQYGPVVNSTYPLGSYIQDYEYVSGLGDLDGHNGRVSKTTEYPNGTYAYYITTNSTGDVLYPFIIGPYYYGVVVSNRGSTAPTETVSTYFVTGVVGTGTTPATTASMGGGGGLPPPPNGGGGGGLPPPGK